MPDARSPATPDLPWTSASSGYRIEGADSIVIESPEPAISGARVVRLSPLSATVDLPKERTISGAGAIVVTLRSAAGVAEGIEATPVLIPANGVELSFLPSLPKARAVHRILSSLRRTRAVTLAPAPPAVEERISDPVQIRATLKALFANRAEGAVRFEGKLVPIKAARLEPEAASPLHFAVLGETPHGGFDLELVGYNSVYRMSAEGADKDDDFLAVGIPAVLTRARWRWNRRALGAPGLSIRFSHPVWPEIRVEQELADLSYGGVAVPVGDEDLLFPGLVIPDLEIVLQDSGSIQTSAVVRHVSTARRDPPVEIAGLELHPDVRGDRSAWRHFVERTLNASTRRGGTWTQASWQLYERSGYLSLSGKSAAHFAPLKTPFATASRRLDMAAELGCQVVWPSDRGIEASLSLLKVYQGAWLGYQMARQKGRTPLWLSGRQILREIHLHAYEHAQADRDLKWLIGYVQEGARWSRFIHYAFPIKHIASGGAVALRFHAFDKPTSASRGPRDKSIEISPAEPDEIALLLEVLPKLRPSAYVDAMDFVPSRFDLSGLKASWQRAGFSREREVLIARQGGHPCAAAVLETAQEGLHLYGLLDLVRIFPLGREDESIFTQLLEEAAVWYHERGRGTFVYFMESGDPRHAIRAGMRDLGAADMTILSWKLLPDLLEYIYEVTAPRDLPPLT